jgi:hypothetical protein
MAEPTKNGTSVELLRVFQVTGQKLIARGLKSRLMRLDNEASQLFKNYLYEQYISFKLVPSYIHHRNAA